eukprot:scaffold2184_cov128-Cylindrotheca_fusiformis.AAC.4
MHLGPTNAIVFLAGISMEKALKIGYSGLVAIMKSDVIKRILTLNIIWFLPFVRNGVAIKYSGRIAFIFLFSICLSFFNRRAVVAVGTLVGYYRSSSLAAFSTIKVR